MWLWFAAPLALIAGLIAGQLLSAPRQLTTHANIEINAPRPEVFAIISQVEEYAKVVPAIQSTEILSEQRSGPGTRFRETRVFGGKQATATLEITHIEEPSSVRLLSHEGGTLWDSGFQLEEINGKTQIQLDLIAKPRTIFARLLTPWIFPSIQQHLHTDLEAVKASCESAKRN